ncbi:MAG: hypothetical protein A2511_00985 [Deltaproteobacteria bacterium RIFOXYD12_FULL_50_9]|nr:MAG: hypothetical protein A2511_00985 [Deltaproteobacteria bacterium RIFOXYD12_FULL_50_9]
MTATKNDNLKKFGFAFPAGSPHVSRTMMLEELSILLDYMNDASASRDDYGRAIIEANCLGKRTGKNRLISRRYLVELYSLAPNLLLFRALLFFWQRDKAGRSLIALLCAYARDPLLSASAKYILPLPAGSLVNRQSMETYLDTLAPGRYSLGKLASNAKNLNSTWTQTGHLVGRSSKIRNRAVPTVGSVSYALLLGYLIGERGVGLFQTDYVKLLDCSFERAIELAEDASRRGWIILKRMGDVIEVAFPNLITAEEMGWVREQS